MRSAWSVVPVLALLAAGCNEPTSPAMGLSAGAVGPVVNRVSVGSHDLDLAGTTDANFSLVAIGYADGSASGQWSDQFGQGQGGFKAVINCLLVAGNQAWVSGVITSGQTGGVSLVGLPVIARVADLGTSAGEPDAISFSFIGLAVTCTAAPNLPLNPMTGGQVTIN